MDARDAEFYTAPRKCKALCKHRRQCAKYGNHQYSHNFAISCRRCEALYPKYIDPQILWAGTEYEIE